MRSVSKLALVAGAALSLALAAAPQASAAAPANDAFATPETLPADLPAEVDGTTVDATGEPGEPSHTGFGPAAQSSVWYEWTPTSGGPVRIDICEQSPRAVVVVYTGSAPNALTRIAGTDVAVCTATFNATASTHYRIAVEIPLERGAFFLTLRQANPPANDKIANAEVIPSSLPATVDGTTFDATTDPTDFPVGGRQPRRTVWYRWTPTTAATVKVEACNDRFQGPAISVYTTSGHVASTVEIDCRLVFDAQAGTEYFIVLDDYREWPFTMNLTELDPPSNDAFAARQVLDSNLPVTVSGTTLDATAEAGEPKHFGFDPGGGLPPFGPDARVSVWYEWTAPADGRTNIGVCGGSNEGGAYPGIAVYTGDALASLTRIDFLSGGCKLALDAVAGTTYKIVIDRTMGEGPLQLTLSQPDRPANDDFADRQVLPRAMPIESNGTTVDATAEPGEGSHAGFPASQSVWYEWNPEVSGRVLIDTCSEERPGAAIAVYTGDSVTSLTEIASSAPASGPGPGPPPFPSCRLRFDAVADTDYKIAFDSPVFGEDPFPIRIRPLAPPANDDFAARQVLPQALPIVVSGTGVDAGAEAGEPAHTGAPASGSVWYEWTPLADTRVKVRACPPESEGFPGIAVYTGDSLNALTPIAGGTFGCKVTFDATAGTSYKVVLDHSESPFTLDIHALGAPANDQFANRQVLSAGLPVTVNGTTADASAEPGEPSHGGFGPATTSVWYEWAAIADGRVVIDTCGGAFEPASDVYKGDSVGSLSRVGSFPGLPGGCIRGLRAKAGETYKIAVDHPQRDGAFVLNLHALSPPPNDDFANAEAVGPELPVSVPGTVVDASAQSGETDPLFEPTRSVWYTWTPSATAEVTIDTCASDFDSRLAVYTGSSLTNLTHRASDADGCSSPNDLGGRVTFQATAGTTYRISVDAGWNERGSFTLAIQGPATNPPGDPGGSQPPASPAPDAPTGKRAKALAKCKKKKGKRAKASCRKKAKKLPK